MEELSTILSKLLDSPDGIEKLKGLASNFLSNSAETNKDSNENRNENRGENKGGGIEDMLSKFSGGDISKMMSLMSAFNSKEDDNRSRLLISLKPHLSEERRERVDSAVQILRLIKLLPLLNMK